MVRKRSHAKEPNNHKLITYSSFYEQMCATKQDDTTHSFVVWKVIEHVCTFGVSSANILWRCLFLLNLLILPAGVEFSVTQQTPFLHLLLAFHYFRILSHYKTTSGFSFVISNLRRPNALKRTVPRDRYRWMKLSGWIGSLWLRYMRRRHVSKGQFVHEVPNHNRFPNAYADIRRHGPECSNYVKVAFTFSYVSIADIFEFIWF